MFLQKALDGRSLDLLTEIGNNLLFMLNQGNPEQDTAFLTAREYIKKEERRRFLKKYLEVLEQMAHGSASDE